ncbi:DUF916 domain-containing protein [Patescibacteria group bacterium]|nr:DUF916 domain-containing protein [Patescibacteria group bacterium]
MNKILFIAFIIFFFTAGTGFASAYTIEELNFSNEGDIVVGPGKTEVWLDPGSEYTKEIIVSNRSGMEKIINISVEDFQGSLNPDGTIEFMGGKKGPYSLKDYVKPEIEEIILSHGQRLRLPVVISVPQTAEPGGLYGAVMVSASNIKEEAGEVKEGTAVGKLEIITRVASLFFVRVKGDVFEEGSLNDFKTGKNFYEKGPVSLKIIVENTGNVHLSPYGTIDIKNILGAQVGQVELDPWFVMPKSVRTREVKWNAPFLFGRYTAQVSLNRGYKDIVDTMQFSFWVIPWRIVLIALIALILLICLLVWFFSHFEFKKKTTNKPI